MNLSFPPSFPHSGGWGSLQACDLSCGCTCKACISHWSQDQWEMLPKDFTSGSSNMLDWSRVRSHWASSPLCWNLVDSLSLHTIKRGPKGFFPNQYLCYLSARIWDFRAKWGKDLGLKACTERGKVVCRKQPLGLLDWGKIWVGIHA